VRACCLYSLRLHGEGVPLILLLAEEQWKKYRAFVAVNRACFLGEEENSHLRLHDVLHHGSLPHAHSAAVALFSLPRRNVSTCLFLF
jgi:hypothetical protein